MSSYGGRGPTLNAVLWTETVVASIFAALRIYTRKVILRSLGLDDLFLVLTLVLLGAYAALISAGTAHGIGRKREEISPEDYVEAMKHEIIGQAVCIFNIAIARAAVAFFLLRIVRKTWHKVGIWFFIVTNTIVATFTTLAVLIQCIPIQAVWDPSVEDANCWLDFATVGLTCSAYAVVVDFTLALFPCFVIWELNMKTKEKILTISGLSLGVFAGICGIMRTVSLTSLRSFDEYIYDTVDMLIYSGSENFVSVICASIPVLRPLYTKIRGYSSADDSYGRSYQMSGLKSNGKDAEATLGGSQFWGGPDDDDGKGIATTIFSGREATDDNASEESILRRSSMRDGAAVGGDAAVHCRTDISVNYTSRDEM